jgi:hypothetical protein
MKRITIVKPVRVKKDRVTDLDLRTPSGRRLPY